MNVLVFGARQNSLGAHIADIARLRGWTAVTAGESLYEDHIVDVVTDPVGVRELLETLQPDAIVCTVGVNEPRGMVSHDLMATMMNSYQVNVLGPLQTLRSAMNVASVKQFCAISSNSAEIARRGSLPYCSSKAALSMALRVAAREMAGSSLLVYGFEFGLLYGTPMTERVRSTFEGPLTRIPGQPSGLDVRDAAFQVVDHLKHPWPGLNGVMLRYDGGEQ